MTIEFSLDNKIAHILFNRPEKRNAFNQDMLRLLIDALEKAKDSDAKAIVIKSKHEGVFCAGADIWELVENCKNENWVKQNQILINQMQISLANINLPSIAFIDGDCIGGGLGIALACDIRIATSRSRFGITPAKLGLVYPVHDTKLLVDTIGPAHAKQLLFSAAIIDADRASYIGLINEISDSYSNALTQIMENSSFSLNEIKKQVRQILNGKTCDGEQDLEVFRSAFSGQDFLEGVTAFKEKRKPRFK